jgi:hypothetical protein
LLAINYRWPEISLKKENFFALTREVYRNTEWFLHIYIRTYTCANNK